MDLKSNIKATIFKIFHLIQDNICSIAFFITFKHIVEISHNQPRQGTIQAKLHDVAPKWPATHMVGKA